MPATDVVARAILLVDTSEGKGATLIAQGPKPGLQLGTDDGRIDLGSPELTVDQARGCGAHRLEAREGAVNVSLLEFEIWVGHPRLPAVLVRQELRSRAL